MIAAGDNEQATNCIFVDPRIPKLLALCESVYKWVRAHPSVIGVLTSLLTVVLCTSAYASDPAWSHGVIPLEHSLYLVMLFMQPCHT